MDNLRGILLMVAAMAGFAIEDVFVKTLATAMPVAQILVFLGLGGGAAFALLAARRGAPLRLSTLRAPGILLRSVGEVVGTIGFVTALALTPLSTASAILQATPLAVTLGAALFLREPVGWRRWSAILVGFAGVLLIVRPGAADFDPATLFAVQGVIGLAIRDLATRIVPAEVPTLSIAAWGQLTLMPTGIVLFAISAPPVLPSAWDVLMLACALGTGVLAYYWITAAMRLGEVAVITPFRYTRLLFALGLGAVIFGEQPDALTLTGAGLVIASGLYTLNRERRLARARRGLSSAGPPV